MNIDKNNLEHETFSVSSFNCKLQVLNRYTYLVEKL